MSTNLKFSFIPQVDYRYPLMLQSKANDLYTFGEMNDYPYYLLDIYKKSAKHKSHRSLAVSMLRLEK